MATALLFCVLGVRTVTAQQPTNEAHLLQRLVEQGVRLSVDTTIKLPAPTLADGLTSDQQRKTVTRIAGRYGWQSFVRRSAVAPFMLQQAYVKDQQGQRIGHVVDLWFVAYGKLADFENERLAEDLFGAERSAQDASEAHVRELDASELERLGLKVDKDVERFVLAEFPLMNRVHVRGVGHAQQVRTDQSIQVAWELDPRFDQDDSLANRWYPLETTELGQRKRGAARPYQGYGGYLKITQLSQPDNALLFEAHVVFHEPKDWFRGSNFLRSKTPLLVKENVDKLRRKLTRIHRPDS